MKPDEFRNLIREEVTSIVHDQVSLVIEEKVPKMIDERVAKIIQEQVPVMIDERVAKIIQEQVPVMIDEQASRHFGIMKEWFGHQFGLLNEKIDLNQEKNNRNFAEIREDLSHIYTVLDEHTIEIVNLKKNRVFAQQSWRPS